MAYSTHSLLGFTLPCDKLVLAAAKLWEGSGKTTGRRVPTPVCSLEPRLIASQKCCFYTSQEEKPSLIVEVKFVNIPTARRA